MDHVMARLRGEQVTDERQKEAGYVAVNNKSMEDLASADLTAAQLKICLAILRLTWGYNKKEDRISYGQIQELTNLPKQTISKEIARLVEYNVITRSNYKARKIATFGYQKYTEWWKLPNRKEIARKKFGCSPTDEQMICSPASEQIKIDCSPAVEQICSPASDTPKTEIQKDITLGDKPKPDPKPKSDHKKVMDYYHDKFVEKFGEKPIIAGGKDGQLIKQIIAAHGVEKTIERLDLFFTIGDPWIKDTGYTIGVFYASLNKLIAAEKRSTETSDKRGGPKHR